MSRLTKGWDVCTEGVVPRQGTGSRSGVSKLVPEPGKRRNFSMPPAEGCVVT